LANNLESNDGGLNAHITDNFNKSHNQSNIDHSMTNQMDTNTNGCINASVVGNYDSDDNQSNDDPNGISGCEVFVKRLPSNYIALDVKRLFEPYGEVLQVKLIVNERSRSRCFAFVTFEDCESAFAAINSLNGAFVGKKDLFVTFSKSKYERQMANNQN